MTSDEWGESILEMDAETLSMLFQTIQGEYDALSDRLVEVGTRLMRVRNLLIDRGGVDDGKS